jgi:hypothetical protein
MIRFLRRLYRRIVGPVPIPGVFPWRKGPAHPTYGTTLFEDKNFRHYADGLGGIVSVTKIPRAPGIGRAVQSRASQGKR